MLSAGFVNGLKSLPDGQAALLQNEPMLRICTFLAGLFFG